MRAFFYIFLCTSELLVVSKLGDLDIGLQNWAPAAHEILSFNFPTSNFYGPGAAISLIPFLWAGPDSFIANLFYFALGSFAYYLLCKYIDNNKLRLIALSALPFNVYLIWLCYSSQDTVIEFCFLLWMILFLIQKKYLAYTFAGFILCETRSGYWALFLGLALYSLIISFKRKHRINYRMTLAIPLLFITSTTNFIVYDSPSPALGGGITQYFSFTKYHYLSLPKMDMDVFLSGPNGSFSSGIGPFIPPNSSEAQADSIYRQAAIDSVISNPKETILSLMQKFDSYVFDVQKIPHLPGAYVLDQKNMTIKIKDERLYWNLVIGNLLYALYRSFLLLMGLIALGLYIFPRVLRLNEIEPNLKKLLLPWLFGLVPGLLLYTETRFKIVSELILVPLICQVWAKFLELKKSLIK